MSPQTLSSFTPKFGDAALWLMNLVRLPQYMATRTTVLVVRNRKLTSAASYFLPRIRASVNDSTSPVYSLTKAPSATSSPAKRPSPCAADGPSSSLGRSRTCSFTLRHRRVPPEVPPPDSLDSTRPTLSLGAGSTVAAPCESRPVLPPPRRPLCRMVPSIPESGCQCSSQDKQASGSHSRSTPRHGQLSVMQLAGGRQVHHVRFRHREEPAAVSLPPEAPKSADVAPRGPRAPLEIQRVPKQPQYFSQGSAFRTQLQRSS